jgi:TonB family protein
VSNDRQGLYAVEFGKLPESLFAASLRAPMSQSEIGLSDFVLPPDVVMDVSLALSDFNITGDPALGWRVRLISLYSPVGLDHFVVLQGDEARLLGVAGGRMPPVLWGLGKRAAAMVEAGDLAKARQWIEWARESLRGTRDRAWSRFFVSSTPEAIATAEGLTTAADALASTGSLRKLAGVSPTAGAGVGAPVVPAALLFPGVLPFSDRMTRPLLKSSPNGMRSPDYPEESRAAGVSGLLIVRCTLSEAGKAEECTIVKPLEPSLDREVLDWLARSTWSPITLDGRPRRVSYVFNFNFLLQLPGR